MIKLLLVEDDANLSYIIQGGLEDMIGGYEVIIACNGKEGLEKYRQVKPDIIVADIEMPVMDGYEMVRRIRETDRELPILFSSARVSPKDVVKGMNWEWTIMSKSLSCRKNWMHMSAHCSA